MNSVPLLLALVPLLFSEAAEAPSLQAELRVFKTRVITNEPILVRYGVKNMGELPLTVLVFNVIRLEWRDEEHPWTSCDESIRQFPSLPARSESTIIAPHTSRLDKFVDLGWLCRNVGAKKHYWLRARATDPQTGEISPSPAVEMVISAPRSRNESILIGYQLFSLPTDGSPPAPPRITMGALLAGAPMASGNRPALLASVERAKEFVRLHPDFMFNDLIEYHRATYLALMGEWAEARAEARKLSQAAEEPKIREDSKELLKIIDELEYVIKPKWST
jgi:hypothetical protein